MNLHNDTDLFVLAACVLGIFGGYYLVISTIKNGKEEIVGLASTFFGDNPIILSSLAEQKISSAIGFGLSTFSGIMWLISSIWSPPIEINFSTLTMLFLFSAVIVLSSEVSIRFFTKKLKSDVNLISFAYHVEGNLKSDYHKNLEALIQDAQRSGLAHLMQIVGPTMKICIEFYILAEKKRCCFYLNLFLTRLNQPLIPRPLQRIHDHKLALDAVE